MNLVAGSVVSLPLIHDAANDKSVFARSTIRPAGVEDRATRFPKCASTTRVAPSRLALGEVQRLDQAHVDLSSDRLHHSRIQREVFPIDHDVKLRRLAMPRHCDVALLRYDIVHSRVDARLQHERFSGIRSSSPRNVLIPLCRRQRIPTHVGLVLQRNRQMHDARRKLHNLVEGIRHYRRPLLRHSRAGSREVCLQAPRWC